MAKRVQVKPAEAKDENTNLSPGSPDPAPAAEPVVEAAADQQVITAYDDILDICRSKVDGFKTQGARETAQQYFARMITVMSEIEDDEFEQLPEAVRNWYNNAGELINDGKPAEAPEGFINLADKPKAAAGNGSAGATKRQPPPPRKPMGTGVVALSRKIVVENSTLTSAALKEMAAKMLPDLKDSTFAAVYADTMATIKLAQELDHWK